MVFYPMIVLIQVLKIDWDTGVLIYLFIQQLKIALKKKIWDEVKCEKYKNWNFGTKMDHLNAKDSSTDQVLCLFE